MKVLIDTNVFIDIAQNRKGLVDASRLVTAAVYKKRVSGVVSANSITTIYYLLKKAGNHKTAIELIEKTLKIYEVSRVDKSVLETALESGFSDFEDAVIYACASASKVDYIITRDVKDFKKSKIKALTPEQFMRLL